MEKLKLDLSKLQNRYDTLNTAYSDNTAALERMVRRQFLLVALCGNMGSPQVEDVNIRDAKIQKQTQQIHEFEDILRAKEQVGSHRLWLTNVGDEFVL